MSEGTIHRAQNGAAGSYTVVEGGVEAVLTYSRLGTTRVIADRTHVPAGLVHTGVGLKLVERLVADARADGFLIVPLCPFVKALRGRHPHWADAFDI